MGLFVFKTFKRFVNALGNLVWQYNALASTFGRDKRGVHFWKVIIPPRRGRGKLSTSFEKGLH
jgi:hypothetical protein